VEAAKKQVARKQPLEWETTVAMMFKQICNSVQWMHKKCYCHLDLSLENTMIGAIERMDTKIIDLGLTQHFPKGDFTYQGRVGKLQYMSPEAYARQKYDARAADIYCLGVMLFMMLVGAPPYKAPQLQVPAFKYIMDGRVSDVLKHWKRLSMLTEDAVDLLERTMCYEKHRISMKDLLAHPFFKNVQEEVQNTQNDDMKTSQLNAIDGIEEQVSSMSLDNNQQEHPPPSNNQQVPLEVKEQSDATMSPEELRCRQLLHRWGLVEIFDVLLATGWYHPDDWNQLTVSILRFEVGIEREYAERFIECYKADFENGVDVNNGQPHNQHQQHAQQAYYPVQDDSINSDAQYGIAHGQQQHQQNAYQNHHIDRHNHDHPQQRMQYQ